MEGACLADPLLQRMYQVGEDWRVNFLDLNVRTRTVKQHDLQAGSVTISIAAVPVTIATCC